MNALLVNSIWASTLREARRSPVLNRLPIVGEVSRYLGFFTAAAANGYTMAPILGAILAELITVRGSPIDLAPFSNNRFE